MLCGTAVVERERREGGKERERVQWTVYLLLVALLWYKNSQTERKRQSERKERLIQRERESGQSMCCQWWYYCGKAVRERETERERGFSSLFAASGGTAVMRRL